MTKDHETSMFICLLEFIPARLCCTTIFHLTLAHRHLAVKCYTLFPNKDYSINPICPQVKLLNCYYILGMVSFWFHPIPFQYLKAQVFYHIHNQNKEKYLFPLCLCCKKPDTQKTVRIPDKSQYYLQHTKDIRNCHLDIQ